jgi:4-amino-4-deoxy-L-arabinose transferase-like glycosyltransferase
MMSTTSIAIDLPEGAADNATVRRDILALGLVAAIAAAVFFGAMGVHGPRYKYPGDAVYFADIARNLIEGHGFVSNRLVPRVAYAFGLEPTPVQSKAFTGPLATALMFLLLGISDASMIVASLPYVVLTILPLYRLTRGLAGRETAAAAVLIYLAEPGTWLHGLGGLREPLYGWLLLEAFSLTAAERVRAGLIAALVGLVYLTRELHVPAALLAIAVVARTPRGRRLKSAALFALVYAIVISPSLWIQHAASGINPFTGFVALHTRLYPGLNHFVSLDNFSDLQFLREHPGEVARKMLRGGVIEFLLLTTAVINPLILATAAVALLRRFDARALSFSLSATAFLAIVFFGDLASHPSERHYAFLIAPIAALGAIGLRELVGPSTRRIAALLAILLLAWSVPALARISRAWPRKNEHPLVARALPPVAALIPARDAMITNFPEVIPWYAGYIGIELSATEHDIVRLAARRPVEWMVLVELNPEDTWGSVDYDSAVSAALHGSSDHLGPFRRLQTSVSRDSVTVRVFRRSITPNSPGRHSTQRPQIPS